MDNSPAPVRLIFPTWSPILGAIIALGDCGVAAKAPDLPSIIRDDATTTTPYQPLKKTTTTTR